MKLLATLWLLALALPAAALAGRIDLSRGPATVRAGGGVYGTVSLPAGRALVLQGKSGWIRVTDLAGDLRLRCPNGLHSGTSKRDAKRRLVVFCMGLGPGARVYGSRFELAASARRWTMTVPAGAAGQVMGPGLR